MATVSRTATSGGLWSRLQGWLGGTGEDKVVIPVRGGASAWLPQSTTQSRVHRFDQTLLWVIIGLLVFGTVMVYSATVALSDGPRFESRSSFYFLIKHAISIGVGAVALGFMLLIPVKLWEKAAPWIFMLSIVGLILVLFIGRDINGAKRWVSLGVMNFQPSELAKFAVVLYASNYMVRKMEVKERFFRAVTPMVVAIALMGGLILAEPDMGAFLVIAIISMGILFLGGVNGRMFFLMAAVLVLAFVLMIALSDWRRERIFAYLDPWSAQNVFGKSYQLTHALMALGRGMLFGVGLGSSMEKLNWLPEPHTDFLVAVIGEELGFIGVVAMIIAFFWLTRRMIYIGRQAIALDRVFAGLVAQGVALWMGFQAFINIGVNLGALPTKGLTLPLISYGGSAILMNLIAIGMVLRIDMENRAMMRGESK
ncbi:putative peptidoglycan glycosyltransferase FtsW [Saezia sanguinis]|uniref:Probable peptidoglycan glycosyltransferase FtsW n=1 Tax=Saezia sanguinis TaxID=1965230 RepID=A0A433SDR0_9BURK|nr:putative lipid II flippase FtsW [Saezia sanguinis]RUS66868.1 putative peptidoglycan glycosyltransferase FtsW [Saezia sanguinis]